MIRVVLVLILFIFLGDTISAQDFSIYQYRDLGPYRGGRVTTVAGIVSQPSTFYLGATGGGVWKTEDYGISWKNISDGFFETPSIGAIAVAQNDPNIIYVGTGSDGLRSNVITGKGMYKSIDGGENWIYIGLKNTGQIGGVRIDPTNHNIVYVAAIGQAFNANEERGIYKTINGGKTWKKILYVSNQTGFSDIELMPSNPEIIYAAAWKGERKPWTIISGGTLEEGGIYKSTDGGATWEKIDHGLPAHLIGKIDLEVCQADSRIVYALVEAPDKEGGLYKSTDQGETFTQVSDHKGIRDRPFYYTNITVDPTNPEVVYSNSTRFHKSENSGKTWKTIGTPHGDNHDMWINPNDSQLFIQSNDGGANVTHNGGKTWSTQNNQPTAEIYQVEVDDQYPYWLYGGQQDNSTTIAVPSQAPYGMQLPGIGYVMNTGGCETGPAVPKPGNHNVVYSNCKGKFTVYDKLTGTEKSYYVGASNMYGHNPADLKYRFQRVSPIHVSPHNPDVIYHTSQYVHKTMDEGKTWETISPDLTAFEADKQVISGSPITRDITGEEFYSTIYAIRESQLEKGLIWVGANDGPIHMTRDGGLNWKDVTPKGMPSGGRVDAVEPSPHDPAKAYACILRYQLGDWKPYIYKTSNFGTSWTLLTNGSNGIPDHYPCRVVREDPTKEGLLYAGTEYGMFVSMDDGRNWKSFQQNLPITPITDLKVHRGDLAISTMGRGFWILEDIGSLTQMTSDAITNTSLFQPTNTIRYQYPSGARNSTTPRYPRPAMFIDYYLPDTTDDLQIDIVNSKEEIIASLVNDNIKVEEQVIENMSLNEVTYIVDKSLKTMPGLHRYKWDMTQTGPWHKDESKKFKDGPTAEPGDYTLKMTAGEEIFIQSFTLEMDPRIATHTSKEDIQAQGVLQIQVRDLLSAVRKLKEELIKEKKTLQKSKISTEEGQLKLEKISAQLKMITTEDGIYMQPMLEAQISYLYGMLNKTDQLPGQDAQMRYAELKAALEEIQKN